MVTVSGIAKSYGVRELFSEVSFQINREDRMALVGNNGAGKTTLFSILLEEESPDEGMITRERGIRLGYLPQETAPDSDETVIEVATTLSPEVARLRRVLRAYESGSSDDDESYHKALADLSELHVYQSEPLAKKILSGLAFKESDFDRPARELSGGWRMRAHLARLLVMKPDLLLLDEPTNHLDLESVLWFQNYLANQYRGAVLTISHDREFINAVVDQILEIRHRRLHRYPGNYEAYLEQRDARDQIQKAAYENQQKQIKNIQQSANRFRASARRASQAQNKLKQIDRMEMVDAPQEDEAAMHFQFPQPGRAGQRPIRLAKVDQAYGEHQVYRGLDFECERGDKTVLVGPNGAGKSTLLKLLAGMVDYQSGKREVGHNVRIGYYAQDRTEMLNPGKTVLEEALTVTEPLSEEQTRTLLGCFLFRGDDVFKPVSVLSGGEKGRLALVKLLLDPPNLLLMDEPTTHLDLNSTEALINALKQFQGTLIFISHDVYFIRQLSRKTLHIDSGEVTPYAGGYDYFLEKAGLEDGKWGVVAKQKSEVRNQKSELSDRRAASGELRVTNNEEKPKSRKNSNSKEERWRRAQEQDEANRHKREAQKKIERLEQEIMELESRQKELAERLEDPEVFQGPDGMKINSQLVAIEESLKKLNAEWEAVAEGSEA
jgi:ATP-binding cassette subfamily F protein 3